MLVQLGHAAARSLFALSLATSPLQPALLPAYAVESPSAEAQALLRKGFQSAQAGLPSSADVQLSKAILEWERTKQAPDEVAALYKTRGIVRNDLGRPSDALADLTRALSLSLQPGSNPDPAEIPRTYQLRARINQLLGNIRAQEVDLTKAIERWVGCNEPNAHVQAPAVQAPALRTNPR